MEQFLKTLCQFVNDVKCFDRNTMLSCESFRYAVDVNVESDDDCRRSPRESRFYIALRNMSYAGLHDAYRGMRVSNARCFMAQSLKRTYRVCTHDDGQVVMFRIFFFGLCRRSRGLYRKGHFL